MQKTELEFSLLKQATKANNRWQLLVAIGLLSFLLLFVQAANLVHNHETDLASTIHCDICLKAGSLEHAIGNKAATLPVQSVLIDYNQPELRLIKSPHLAPVARAPPLTI